MKFFLVLVFAAFASCSSGECPLKDSGCPLYSTERESGQDCPAKNCPYYSEHKMDKSERDAVDASCPVASCPYYDKKNRGDLSQYEDGACPLSDKWSVSK